MRVLSGGGDYYLAGPHGRIVIHSNADAHDGEPIEERLLCELDDRPRKHPRADAQGAVHAQVGADLGAVTSARLRRGGTVLPMTGWLTLQLVIFHSSGSSGLAAYIATSQSRKVDAGSKMSTVTAASRSARSPPVRTGFQPVARKICPIPLGRRTSRRDA